MATKDQDAKARTAKAPAKKKPAAKAERKSAESIGFLRAAEKAHVGVVDIPLTFFQDLGIAPDRMKSAKKLNRKFISGMYERLDNFTDSMGSVAGAPVKLLGSIVEKFNKVAEPKPAAKSKAKATKVKPKPKKAAAKAKPKATAAKSKKAAATAKAKPKAAATKAKSRARPATKSKAAATDKSEVKLATKQASVTGPAAAEINPHVRSGSLQ